MERALEYAVTDLLLVSSYVSKGVNWIVREERKRRSHVRSQSIREQPLAQFQTLLPEVRLLYSRWDQHLKEHFGVADKDREARVHAAAARRFSVPGLDLQESIPATKVEWGSQVTIRKPAPIGDSDSQVSDGSLKVPEILKIHWLEKTTFEGEDVTAGCLGLGSAESMDDYLGAPSQAPARPNSAGPIHTLRENRERDRERLEKLPYQIVAVSFQFDPHIGGGVSSVSVVAVFETSTSQMIDSHWTFYVACEASYVTSTMDGLPERLFSTSPSVFGNLFVRKPHSGNEATPAMTEVAGEPHQGNKGEGEGTAPLVDLIRFELFPPERCPWGMSDLLTVAACANAFTDDASINGLIEMLDIRFFSPMSLRLTSNRAQCFTVTEIERDLTTPKGIWRCSTGIGSLQAVDITAQLQRKRERHLSLIRRLWGRNLKSLFSLLPIGTVLTYFDAVEPSLNASCDLLSTGDVELMSLTSASPAEHTFLPPFLASK